MKGSLERFFDALLCLLRLLLDLGESTALFGLLAEAALGSHFRRQLRSVRSPHVFHLLLIGRIALSYVEVIIVALFISQETLLPIWEKISINLGDMLTIFVPVLPLQQRLERHILHQALPDRVIVVVHKKILLAYFENYAVSLIQSIELIEQAVVLVRVLEFVIGFNILNFI